MGNLYFKLLYHIILLFSVGIIQAQEYKIKKEIILVELTEYKLDNQSLISNIDSLILIHNLDIDDRENYIYLFRLSNNCTEEYLISVTLMRPTLISDSCNIGFFRLKNSIFLIQGEMLREFFVDTGKKEVIPYIKRVVELSGKEIDYDNLMPEEFISWFFSYSNREFKLLKTNWYPKLE
ncbi:hypothetical protein D0T84_20945 [Dysgonomonas sp. 521]|uniref:hypothetical protein n=1 Tax=Dysgonomonas sp. 521 TaxID=2302932 RepID=UPI0013D0F74F|nr:hypothetical protein [Dysgonomonas sp. 521]NDV97346.1 hypothetical protein [Dysgonomonas sp. 521]